MKKTLNVLWTKIVLFEQKEEDYIFLTDIAKYKSDTPDLIIQNWMRNRNTIEFLWLWEKLNNLNLTPHRIRGIYKRSLIKCFFNESQKMDR